MSALVSRATDAMDDKLDLSEDKVERLENLDFFILDNSIRESTVGQLRGHTLENKQAIYRWTKKCGMHSIIVASFSQMHRVDDEFCRWLKDTGEDFSKLFSFSEVFGGKVSNGVPDTDTIPNSLIKNKKFGLYNTVFELDLGDGEIEWDTKWTVDDMCQLIQKWMFWVYDNINPNARIFLNLRDLPMIMPENPERVLSVVEFVSKMPKDKRMAGIVFEDALAEALPDELAADIRAVRDVMDGCGWTDGHLLVHVHDKWELQTPGTLECLAGGGDGMWGSLCVEGAAMEHACSTVTLMNLIRLGNTKVLDAYNCKEFRKAAIEVTKLTTTKDPHPKQCVYGERSLDVVFGFGGMGGAGFNIAEFFGERTENRINTLASPQMVIDRMTYLFGSDDQFTQVIGKKMLEKMLEDLRSGRKEEYHSAPGLAMLFDRCGGQMNARMSQAIANVKVNGVHHQRFIAEIREIGDFWDSKEPRKRDAALDFDSFYHGFLSPYFGCYRCTDTKQALQAMDMDKDGCVDWDEFLVYIKWALSQYPNVTTSDQVIEIAFQKGLIPAMRDVKIKNPEMHGGSKRVQRRRHRNRQRNRRR